MTVMEKIDVLTYLGEGGDEEKRYLRTKIEIEMEIPKSAARLLCLGTTQGVYSIFTLLSGIKQQYFEKEWQDFHSIVFVAHHLGLDCVQRLVNRILHEKTNAWISPDVLNQIVDVEPYHQHWDPTVATTLIMPVIVNNFGRVHVRGNNAYQYEFIDLIGIIVSNPKLLKIKPLLGMAIKKGCNVNSKVRYTNGFNIPIICQFIKSPEATPDMFWMLVTQDGFDYENRDSLGKGILSYILDMEDKNKMNIFMAILFACTGFAFFINNDDLQKKEEEKVLFKPHFPTTWSPLCCNRVA